jgi:conjugal transfer pilus assembly protein TrbC
MMKKTLIAILSFLVMSSTFASTQKKLFISFSMPEMLLEQLASESVALQVPIILNGLHQGSMRKTLEKIFALSQKEKGLSVQIDPTAFSKYGITRVPALVVDDGINFDVVRGNIHLKDMIEIIKEDGETHA